MLTTTAQGFRQKTRSIINDVLQCTSAILGIKKPINSSVKQNGETAAPRDFLQLTC